MESEEGLGTEGPAKRAGTSEKETEYDGGWFWSAAVAAVGIGMTVIGYATVVYL